MAENVMAYWYNLSWGVRQRTLNMDGTVTKGRVERMKDLAWNYELESASVKTKATASVARDIYGNVITKGKKGKEKVKTQKEKYIVPKLKSAQVTFKTEYQVATGTTDILGKIEEIKNMMGSSSPLVIGTEYYDKVTGEMTNTTPIGVTMNSGTGVTPDEYQRSGAPKMTTSLADSGWLEDQS